MAEAICYILPSLVTGGAELQTLQQLAALRRRGHRVGLILLSRRIEPELLARSELEGVLLCQLGGPSGVLDRHSLRDLPRALGPGVAFLRAERFRTVLAVLPAAHLFGRLATAGLARAGQRLFLYRRSAEYAEPWAQGPAMRAYRLASDLLGRVVDTGHIHVSAAIRQHNAAVSFSRADLVLHNAVDLTRVPDQAAAARLVAPEPGVWTLVLAGRLHPNKGHGFFLEVLRRFLDRQRLAPEAVRLVLVGDGPEAAAIRARVTALGLEGTVRLLGRRSNEVVLGLMAAADLVVVPSLTEPFGNVAIEAQAMGARLLASNSLGLDEIVRDGVDGWKFPAGDMAAAESALTRRWRERGAAWDPARVQAMARARFGLEGQLDRLLAYLADPRAARGPAPSGAGPATG